MNVKLKVCGITSIEDARAAIACGAEFLGFNFYPPSPRFIAPVEARAIIAALPSSALPVGIFVNEPGPADVLARMRESGVRLAQLHGDEDAEYCREVGPDRVIKAMRTSASLDVTGLAGYPARWILLDAFDKKLYGGTGKTANWAMAREAARVANLFLAGGLSPENIGEAIREVGPFAVDVNSGVESAPGKKDAGRLRQLREEMEKLT